MNPTREQRIRQIMSGAARDPAAVALRLTTALAEPFYATAMRLRNALFDAGIKRQHRLPRPVISVGNITTGGTGKTPMVQWLARKLLTAGHRPASLLRGYTVGTSTTSDEAALLKQSLNIPVIANPDRIIGGNQLITEHPDIDVILLDDGFQHRRLHRDLDIVLIDATNPFGYGHILPRGLLREPLSGLRRADVLIITRANRIERPAFNEIETSLRRYNCTAPILHAKHNITALIRDGESLPVSGLRDKRVYSFCGIGNPQVFHRDLMDAGVVDAGHTWFPDHHDYSRSNLEMLKNTDAQMIVTTEKDWVKIEPLIKDLDLPIWRAQLQMELGENDATRLMSSIDDVIRRSASSPAPAGEAEAGARSSR